MVKSKYNLADEGFSQRFVNDCNRLTTKAVKKHHLQSCKFQGLSPTDVEVWEKKRGKKDDWVCKGVITVHPDKDNFKFNRSKKTKQKKYWK